jgi:hypothetical protein
VARCWGIRLKDFCPRCGTPRVGSFRFCRSCGLDFDAVAEPASVTTAPITEPVTPAVVAAPPSARGMSRRGKAGVGLAVVFALGAISSLQKPASGSPLATPFADSPVGAASLTPSPDS